MGFYFFCVRVKLTFFLPVMNVIFAWKKRGKKE